MLALIAKPLTVEGFSPFGDVIDIDTVKKSIKINYGLTTRFHDMASIDVGDNAGKAGFSVFEATAVALPHSVKVMENHPLGSQLFYPLCEARFLVLVAPPAENFNVNALELFITNGKQGVNYHKGVWHHYLLPLKGGSQFVVMDRIAEDNNCIEAEVVEQVTLDLNC